MRRDGSLVDSAPLVRRVAGSNPALNSKYIETLGKSFTRSICAGSEASVSIVDLKLLLFKDFDRLP